jgi:hypothetical protein
LFALSEASLLNDCGFYEGGSCMPIHSEILTLKNTFSKKRATRADRAGRAVWAGREPILRLLESVVKNYNATDFERAF